MHAINWSGIAAALLSRSVPHQEDSRLYARSRERYPQHITTREMLHAIVDELPEADLVRAVRILKGLELPPDPRQVVLANARLDDEPDDDDFDGV